MNKERNSGRFHGNLIAPMGELATNTAIVGGLGVIANSPVLEAGAGLMALYGLYLMREPIETIVSNDKQPTTLRSGF